MVASVIGPLSVALQSLNSPQRIVVKLGILDDCGPLFLRLALSTLIVPPLVRLSIISWEEEGMWIRGSLACRYSPCGTLFAGAYAQS